MAEEIRFWDGDGDWFIIDPNNRKHIFSDNVFVNTYEKIPQ